MQLIERYDGMFTTDFESNKQLLNKVAVFRSKELRNEVAGYITRYMMSKGVGKEGLNMQEQEQVQEQEDIKEQVQE